jgi:hypothetical protein
MSEEDVKDIDILAECLKLLLTGQRLAVQGGALADLTGMWLASLPQQMRRGISRVAYHEH